MAAQFNVWDVGAFDLSREFVLTHPTPPVVVSNSVTTSTTRSCYRMHWNTIGVWHDFRDRVVQYWTTGVTPYDKQRNVLALDTFRDRFQSVGTTPAANEGDVKTRLNEFVQAVHSAAANGRNHAPRPSDRHSQLQRWENGVEAREHAGIPDFIMASEYGNPRRITVVVEVKNPWQVTAPLVDLVIQSISWPCVLADLLDFVPLTGLYPARLALEQLYGYMVRNSKQYGVLTTVKGWCFARRENGGQFYITPMFGDFQARQGLTYGAASEGYYVPQGFSILQALYYLSAVAELTPDLDEHPIGGVPGQVELPRARPERAEAAPLIVQPPPPENGQQMAQEVFQGYQFPYQGVQILGGYNQAECIHYDDAFDYKSFQFLPRVSENHLGPKTWIATTLPVKSKVVLKLWDAWNFDEEDRNREASVYLQLRSLWGKRVPSLLVKSPLEFFHALILQYIKVQASQHSF